MLIQFEGNLRNCVEIKFVKLQSLRGYYKN